MTGAKAPSIAGVSTSTKVAAPTAGAKPMMVTLWYLVNHLRTLSHVEWVHVIAVYQIFGTKYSMATALILDWVLSWNPFNWTQGVPSPPRQQHQKPTVPIQSSPLKCESSTPSQPQTVSTTPAMKPRQPKPTLCTPWKHGPTQRLWKLPTATPQVSLPGILGLIVLLSTIMQSTPPRFHPVLTGRSSPRSSVSYGLRWQIALHAKAMATAWDLITQTHLELRGQVMQERLRPAHKLCLLSALSLLSPCF
jgi:hypothetical protein